MKKIAIYCEIVNDKLKDVSYELISKAYSLKQKAFELKQEDNEFEIEAIAIGSSLLNESIADAYCAGADCVTFLKNDDIKEYELEKYADIFIKYYNENPMEIIIFPATITGRMLAPKITTILETGLVADCTGLDFILDKNNEIRLAPTRPTFGSELMATILSKKNPQCATIRPSTFSADFTKNTDGKYIEKEIKTEKTPGIKILRSYQETEDEKIDYSKAKIVLAAGAGLCSKDNSYFEKLKSIAKKLNVDYAVTRKVVDLGIELPNYQIGQTGSTVQADLYITFGISGAIQHIFGMKNSKTIVSVNTDENAEIFKYSDYKMVADAKEVIDDIIKYI